MSPVQDRLRATVEHLAAIDRPSPSDREPAAAEPPPPRRPRPGPARRGRRARAARPGRPARGGPAAARGAARRAGTAVAALSALAFADIATRDVVPGANDNLSAVAALLELARGLAATPPAGLRVLLVSTGSEESSMEGMRGFVARHRGELDPARTTVVVLESIGSPELILLEGEGMMRMHDYDAGARDELAAAARDAG